MSRTAPAIRPVVAPFGKRAVPSTTPATVRPVRARSFDFDPSVAAVRARAEARAMHLDWTGSDAPSFREEMADVLDAIDLRRIRARTISRVALAVLGFACAAALAMTGAAFARVFIPAAFDPLALDVFAGWTASDVFAAMREEARAAFGPTSRP